ncbi:flagellar hook-length control protein FliK [uncultured Thioclava sp.]|uniref:flagellar hook-length control protein FliK n=1 Tax=uncultured Thioclava sp. TaxID=473858 RepID=UPI0025F2C349|nr:flagellar hook-length control protein FliK [uncultured Thioclava sp.]
MSVDTAGATQGSSSVRGEATGHTATATPNMAQSVSRQVAIAVAQMPDQPVEIALSPEELGRVRLVLHASEHGMVVSVQAERPETLDLMRRNIGMLAADMRDLGYSELNFTFSDHPQQQSRHPEPEASSEMLSRRGDRNTDAPATVRPPPMTPLAENASGLDLRI